MLKLMLKYLEDGGKNPVHMEMKAVASSWNAVERTIDFCMSKEVVDRHGDIVRVKGIDLTHFKKNPIALLCHKSTDWWTGGTTMPIGKWENLKVVGDELVGTLRLAPVGTSEEVDTVSKLLASGIFNACSIGFMPTEFKRILDDDGEPTGGWDITKSELYECSIVHIPANQFAVAKSDAPEGFKAEYAEYVLANFVKTEGGMIVHKSLLADEESAANDGDDQGDAGAKQDKAELKFSFDSSEIAKGLMEQQIEVVADNGRKEKRSLMDWLKALVGKSEPQEAEEDPETAAPVVVKGSRALAEAKLAHAKSLVDE